MAEYRAIRVEKGSGGFGGPLTIQGNETKNKVMYITGGGVAPEILDKIVELSGLEPVNGFKTSCPEEQLALVIIDCGGTLRCGLYPKKRIPTHQRRHLRFRRNQCQHQPGRRLRGSRSSSSRRGSSQGREEGHRHQQEALRADG